MSSDALNLWLEDFYGDQVGLKLRLRECLLSQTTPFQRIAVYDSPAFGKVLTMGGSVVLTDLDEATYSEALAHPALQCLSAPKRVLILGGGDGGVAREVGRYPSVESITVVEIDREVCEVCAKHFPRAAAGLADKRVRLVIDDAHRFLRSSTEQWDAIIIDAFELHNPSSDAIHTEPFSQLLAKHLAPGGVAVAPLGCPTYEAEQCRLGYVELRKRFAVVQAYLVHSPSMAGGQWTVAWCAQQGDPLKTTKTDANWLRALDYYHPGLQAGMFALPRRVAVALGA